MLVAMLSAEEDDLTPSKQSYPGAPETAEKGCGGPSRRRRNGIGSRFLTCLLRALGALCPLCANSS